MKFLQLIDALREGSTFRQERHANGVLYFKQGNIYYDEDREVDPGPEMADPLFVPSVSELFEDIWRQTGQKNGEISEPSQLDQFATYLVEGGMIGRQLPNKQWIFVRLQNDALEALQDGSMVGVMEPYPGVADDLLAWYKAGPFEIEDVTNPAKIIRHLDKRSETDPYLSAYSIHPMPADFLATDWKPLFTLEDATQSLANTPIEEPTPPDTQQVTTDMSKYLKLAEVCELLQPFQSRLDGVKFNQIDFVTHDVPLLVPTKGEQLLDASVRIRAGEVSLVIGESTENEISVKFHQRFGAWTQEDFTEAYIEKSTFLGAINRRLSQPIEEIGCMHVGSDLMAVEFHRNQESAPKELEHPSVAEEQPRQNDTVRSSFEQLADDQIGERKFYATQGLTMIVELRIDDGSTVKLKPITGKARGEIQIMSSAMFHEMFDEFSGPVPGLELSNDKGVRIVVSKPNPSEEGWICLIDLGFGYHPIGLTEEEISQNFVPVGFQHAVDIIRYANPLRAQVD